MKLTSHLKLGIVNITPLYWSRFLESKNVVFVGVWDTSHTIISFTKTSFMAVKIEILCGQGSDFIYLKFLE